MLIKDIAPTKQSCDIPSEYFYMGGTRETLVKDRSVLKLIVDDACLAACEYLYDCHIRTTNSSANYQDIGTSAFITIDYSSLSDENKKVFAELVSSGIIKEHDLEKKDGVIPVNIQIPLSENSTVSEVSASFLSIATMFQPQDLLHGFVTGEELKDEIVNKLVSNTGYTDITNSTTYYDYILSQIENGAILPSDDGEVTIGDDKSYRLADIVNSILSLPFFKEKYYYDAKEDKYWLDENLYKIHQAYLAKTNGDETPTPKY